MMTSEDNNLNGVSRSEWMLTKAKVALAVAVIKSRPSGVSPREYTEFLACKLKSHDEGWKKKALERQEEVLRLRQELLMSMATAKVASSREADRERVTVGLKSSSQDLIGPENVALQPDCDSETPELLPTVTSACSADPPHPQGCPLKKTQLPHLQFLQSLYSLHRINRNDHGLESLWFSPNGDAGSVLMDSVCMLLDSIVAACRDPPRLGPCDLLLEACSMVARAMDLFCSQTTPSADFKRRVESSLKELTELLLHCDHLSRLPAAEKLTEYLTALGSSNMSKSFLISHVLCEISTVVDQLWQAFQGQECSGLDNFPVNQYHNSCHLLWIVETLLQKSAAPYRMAVGSEQSGFLSLLEKRVFLLSDEFPLFSLYMWRIGGLLTSSDK